MQMGEKGAGKEVPLCVETEGSTMFGLMMQCNAMQLVVTGWGGGGQCNNDLLTTIRCIV